MIIQFSHIAAFSVLFVAAVWDLNTTEVPDFLSVTGVLLGIGLHGFSSLYSGSLEPLIWSVGIGTVFSIYGWMMYFAGMWGGADAFGMSVLGFAAPFGFSGPGLLHPVNLFLNVMIAGFVYTLLYALYLAIREDSILEDFGNRIRTEEKRISVEILVASTLSALLISAGLTGARFFGFVLFIIFLYRFLEVLEDSSMVRTVSVEDLEPGEVVARTGEIDSVKERNPVGKAVDFFEQRIGRNGFLDSIGKRMGYSEVVGITEEEIQSLREKGVEEVKVKNGVRFVPVFPVALLVTDILGGGITWILLLS